MFQYFVKYENDYILIKYLQKMKNHRRKEVKSIFITVYLASLCELYRYFTEKIIIIFGCLAFLECGCDI